MIQDSALIQRRGALDFLAYYEMACARQESVPLPAVKIHLDKQMLDFNGDRLKLPDWPPVFDSISINKHLQHIAISSTYQAGVGLRETERRHHRSTIRRKIPAIRSKDITFKLCKALRDCLTVSSNLQTLQLNGLPLRERDLIILTKGLAKSTSLENVSLANCPITDEGLEIICQSVKYSTSIKSVDFSGCSLTWRGAEHMANIIKHQGLQRHGAAWAESLRYRQPQFEGMGGLRRVTLNCNILIGDRGAVSLARELAEDLWVKAVDVQRCGLSTRGASRLLEMLKTNSSLCVLDIRNNPLVDKPLIKTIIDRVLMNPGANSSEYSWIKPASPEHHRACATKRRPLFSAARGKATSKMATQKGLSLNQQTPRVAQTQRSYCRSSGVPWRTAARAGRQRGLPPFVTVNSLDLQGAASVKITVESDSEREEDEDEEEKEVVVVEVNSKQSSVSVRNRVTEKMFERIQMELKECQMMLAEERRARLKAESRLTTCETENTRLRAVNHSLESLSAAGGRSAPCSLSALEDEAVIESIENSFTKFHAFLDLLKDAGLGQLASMAGIDQSDFQCVGIPQLSSTVGPISNGVTSLSGGRHRDAQTQASSGSLGDRYAPVRSGDLTTAESQCAIGADRLQDATFGQAVQPVVDEVGEFGTFLELISEKAAGSDYKANGHTSFSKISQKPFPSHPVQIESSSSCHQSISAHRSNNSCAYKQSSDRTNLSGSSASVSDVSEKAESLRSAGSRNREFGWSLSELSERGAEAGRADHDIRFLRSLEGLSQ